MPRPARHPGHLPRTRPSLAVASGAAAALLLSACGTSDAAPAAAGDGPISVVASTDVWGDIASSVGGDAVEVTSIIDDPAQDPHSFEVTTRDQLLVQDAAVVVMNGGGYDPFMEQLLSASGTEAPVVDAVAVSGLEPADEAAADGDDEHAGEDHADEPATARSEDDGHDHGAFNEHVWYDLPTAVAVATAVADALGEVDPDRAGEFTANAEAFAAGLDPVRASAAEVAARAGGTGVAITEPVPDHLLEAMGLEVRTPEAFSEAVEEGTDVSPAVLADTEALFTTGAVAALVYNEQTSGAETEAVQAAAEAAGVPVVPVTETLPAGQDYTQWMAANVEAIRAAVER